MGFPDGTSGKEPTCQCRRHKRHRFNRWGGKIPCNPLQYSCLDNPMNSWPATNHRSPSIRHDWSYLACIPKYYIIFVAMTNGIFPLIALCDFSLLVYRNARNFCVLMFILKLYYIFWLALLIFWWYLEGFLYKQSCHLQRESFIFLFNLDSFFFSFVLWFLWLRLPKLSWIIMTKVGIFVLFPNLEEMLSIFHHWE